MRCDAITLIGRCPDEATHRQGVLRDCGCEGRKVVAVCRHHAENPRRAPVRCSHCDAPVRVTEAVPA